MKQPKDYPMGRSDQVLFMQTFTACLVLIGVIAFVIWEMVK